MKIKIDMSSEAITQRLNTANELRKLCLSLGNSDIGKKIKQQQKNKINKKTGDYKSNDL